MDEGGRKEEVDVVRRWIQEAIKKPGALTRWLKRNRKKVAAATKSPVFTRDGEINTNTLRKLRKTRLYERLSPTIKRRINLAITLERLSKGKKRRRKGKRKRGRR